MNYIHEQSMGGLLKSTFKIFFGHIWTMLAVTLLGFLVLLIPLTFTLTPIFLFQDEVIVITIFGIISYLLFILTIGGLIPAAATVIVSEISLGHKPSVIRAYKRVIGIILGKLFVTTLLSGSIITLGLFLAIAPGILFFLWYVLVSAIVVLENVGGRKALKRSKELGKGYYLRTLGFYILFFITILSVQWGVLLPSMFIPELELVGMTFYYLVSFLTIPLGSIPVVLIYYDLRVRKEAYDAIALAEDLQH